MPVHKTRNAVHSDVLVERDCTDRALWDTYLDSNPAATNYHRYGWREVIENSFGHQCYYLLAKDKSNAVIGILPLVYMQSRLFGRFLVSLPFFNYGGILSDRRESGVALLKEAETLRQDLGAQYVELRHCTPWSEELPTKRHKVSMVLDLAKDAETQWSGFNAKLRNQIRKAEKSDLQISTGGSELLPDFYTVFSRNMRDLGTPVYSQKFFAEILSLFPRDSRIIAVFLHGKPVASGLTVRFRATLEIPWASSIRDYNALCPNNLLYWHALQHAMSIGCTRFDFGRSTPGEGTFKFKEQWGATPLQLNWQYLIAEGRAMPELNNKNAKFEAAIRVWQKLPLPLTRILGPHIVKNIP